MTVEERRARIGRVHRLAPEHRAATVADAADSLVALHSTDPVTVFLSARARVAGADVPSIEDELYVERSVVRMLGMRRTLFVAPRDARPVIQAACTDAIAAIERKRLLGWLADGGDPDPERWLRRAERATLAAFETIDAAATAELTTSIRELDRKIQIGGGNWVQTVSAGTRVLPLLAAQGALLRGRPRGTWISGQYRWSLAEHWLGATQEPVATDDARADLVRRWLRAFGPGTETDLRWWTGLGAGAIRKALASVGAVEVGLDDAVGYVVPDDEPAESPEPWAALLPALDPTTMGWSERDWYLGEHRPQVFDRNGNAGPTAWWCGRVVGAWTQRPDGEIAVGLLEDVGADGRAAIDAEAERLAAWLGDARVTPRFPTPLQKALTAGDL